MDNLNQDPQGGEDVTSSQGQSEVETQPVEAEASVDDANQAEAGEVSAPWESDPRFKGKSAEDVWNAYQEAQKGMGTLSQKAEVANLIQQKFNMTPAQFKAYMDNYELQQAQDQIAQTNPDAAQYVAPIVQRQQQLEGEIALMRKEKELDAFLADKPDYASHRDKLMKLGTTIEAGKSFDEIAREYIGEAIASGQRSAYQKIDTKQKTQATVASRQTKKTMTKTDFENMTAAEMEQFLPKAPPQNRPY